MADTLNIAHTDYVCPAIGITSAIIDKKIKSELNFNIFHFFLSYPIQVIYTFVHVILLEAGNVMCHAFCIGRAFLQVCEELEWMQ